jgi:hypothetical protein
MQKLFSSNIRTLTEEYGVYGLKVGNSNGSTLFFPAAGYRDASGVLQGFDVQGSYWSTTHDPKDVTRPGYLSLNSKQAVIVHDMLKGNALSVRCVKTETRTLTVNNAPNGTVSSTPAAGEVAIGASVTVTATADPGYAFDGWEVMGLSVPDLGSNLLTFEMPASNVTVKPKFVKLYKVTIINNYSPYLTIGTNYSDGMLKSGLKAGTRVTITTSVTDDSYVFFSWDSGDVGITDLDPDVNRLVFDMPANNLTLTSIVGIRPETRTLTVNNAPNGTVSSTPAAGEVAIGASVTVTATADPGYEFFRWNYSGSVIMPTDIDDGKANTLIFNMPTGNVTVAPEFVKLYKVILVDGSDWMRPSGREPIEARATSGDGVKKGTRLRFQWQGASNIVRWEADDDDVEMTYTPTPGGGVTGTLTFFMPARDVYLDPVGLPTSGLGSWKNTYDNTSDMRTWDEANEICAKMHPEGTYRLPSMPEWLLLAGCTSTYISISGTWGVKITPSGEAARSFGIDPIFLPLSGLYDTSRKGVVGAYWSTGKYSDTVHMPMTVNEYGITNVSYGGNDQTNRYSVRCVPK